MIQNLDLVRLIQVERSREIEQAGRARLAACVRACCSAPVRVFGRIARALRPTPQAC
jgi:hypothetical protein